MDKRVRRVRAVSSRRRELKRFLGNVQTQPRDPDGQMHMVCNAARLVTFEAGTTGDSGQIFVEFGRVAASSRTRRSFALKIT